MAVVYDFNRCGTPMLLSCTLLLLRQAQIGGSVLFLLCEAEHEHGVRSPGGTKRFEFWSVRKWDS